MAKMLLRDLTFSEQMALASLSHHAGFEVLTKIMDEACREAAADPIRLDPVNTQNYDEKLKTLTLIARITNDFCATIRNTVNTHITAAVTKAQQDELEAKMEEESDRVLSTVRLLSKQDNKE